MKLTGKLVNIDSSGDYFSLGAMNKDFSFTNIMCYIKEEHLEAVSKFKTDQKVIVVGTITGVGEVMGYSLNVESIE